MDFGITIIGAGVIGLAIASELPEKYNKIVLEKNFNYGDETSSRNSEIIHSAINYPKNSLKARLCFEGNSLIYEACYKNEIPHKKIGKLIIAQNDEEIQDLEFKLTQARENNVKNVSLISRNKLKELEPNIEARAALLSEDTGIMNAHYFMNYLFNQSKKNNSEFLFNNEVINIDKVSQGYEIELKNGEKFTTEILINAAGLNSHKIANLLGFNYKQYYFKGDYFSVHNGKNKLVSRIIYPVSKKDSPGLGIHITLDLNGRMKLGPDAYLVEEINYNVDENKKNLFYEDVKKFFPLLELNDLEPDISGIRPKLQGINDSFKDFYINQDLPGLINLMGIESPGLTSSLAIAKHVKKLLFD